MSGLIAAHQLRLYNGSRCGEKKEESNIKSEVERNKYRLYLTMYY